MSELNEFREELDHVGDRVNSLEVKMDWAGKDATAARVDARTADRKVSGLRADLQSEVRDGFAKIRADLAQITALLASSHNKSK